MIKMMSSLFLVSLNAVLLAMVGMAAFILAIDWTRTFIAFFGSLAGAVILAYFRRLDDRWELGYRTLAATLAGVIFGSAGIRYFDIQTTEYVLSFYSGSGLILIFIIKALLAIGDGSLKGMIETISYKLIDAFVPGRTPQQIIHVSEAQAKLDAIEPSAKPIAPEKGEQEG